MKCLTSKVHAGAKVGGFGRNAYMSDTAPIQ